MRGVVIGRRMACPNGLALIGSLLNRTPQLSYFSSKSRQIRGDSADKERISKYPYRESVVCTREQKEELARIATTLPENAPALVKRFVEEALLKLQRIDGWDFEDKVWIMHRVVSPLPSRGTRQIQEDCEGKERIRESVCTREQKEELARIAKTLPEDAPALVKRFVERALLKLQRIDGWDFEDKVWVMHKVVSPTSFEEIRQIQKDYEGKERIPESLCKREQKEELARIATTLPEDAPDAMKRFVQHLALTLQGTDEWDFEEKRCIMHRTIKVVVCMLKEEREGKERIRESVCTKAQKQELARIAKTLPESAPDIAKRHAENVALALQHSDRWDFEDKILIMHETIEELSQG